MTGNGGNGDYTKFKDDLFQVNSSLLEISTVDKTGKNAYTYK